MTRNSSIDTLDDDILLSIFELRSFIVPSRRFCYNPTDIRKVSWDSSVLCELHQASQVCQRWRNLILQASPIWGRLIDIDLLAQKVAFRQQVMRWAGTSVLSINAQINSHHPERLAWFKTLLREEWHRIRSIHVALTRNLCQTNLLAMLLRPAPALENFAFDIVRHGHTTGYPDLTIPLELFSQKAPHLTLFRSCNVPVDLMSKQPWFAKIRELGLSDTESVTDLKGVLNAVAQMPLLEYLDLHSALGVIEPVSSKPTTPLISLPRLQYLHVQDYPGTCAWFVEKLLFPPTCCLSLDCYSFNFAFDIIGDDKTPFSEALDLASRVSDQMASLRRHIRALEIRIDESHVSISTNDLPPLNEKFEFIVNDENLHDFSALDLWNKFNFKELNNITHLDLGLTFPRINNTELISKTTAVLQIFPSVTTLTVSKSAIAHLVTTDTPVLPYLEVLKHFPRDHNPKVDHWLAFMEWRKSMNCVAIKTLDLTSARRDPHDGLEAMDCYEGLMIKWKQTPSGKVLEYVCGSGDPLALRYSHETDL